MMEPESRDPGVLGGLPRSRPQRRSERRGPAAAAAGAAPSRASATDAPPPPAGPQGLVGTTGHVVGELAQLGLTVANQVLRGALSRLPRP
jgi:hypothetical protein